MNFDDNLKCSRMLTTSKHITLCNDTRLEGEIASLVEQISLFIMLSRLGYGVTKSHQNTY